MSKIDSRRRRARRGRSRMLKAKAYRLVVFRSARHTYAQLTSPGGDQVLASASSLEKEARVKGDKKEVAAQVGRLIGKRVLERDLGKVRGQVAFDRSGYAYHGRVRALADGAREAGLEI